MKQPTHWDIARAAKTMGVQASIRLDPDKITVRVKNKLVKQLRQGVISGGYQSHARRIGELLCDTLALPLARDNGYYMTLPAGLSADLREQIKEIYNADWTAHVTEGQAGHYIKHMVRERDYKLSQLDKGTEDIYMSLHDKVFKQQVIELLGADVVRNNQKQIDHAVELLCGDAPIHCYDTRAGRGPH